jgi:hypothetical protein
MYKITVFLTVTPCTLMTPVVGTCCIHLLP